VSSEDEANRVIPVIQSIRNADERAVGVKDVILSIDTHRAEVAKAAILAGANCFNDIHSFTGPEYPINEASVEHLLRMRRYARELAVPTILMHSRGEALEDGAPNEDYSEFASFRWTIGEAVMEGVRAELGAKVDAIVKGRGGVRRWFIIVDPGIGFAKPLDGNLEVVGLGSKMVADIPLLSGMRNPLAGFPYLIAPSKKAFLAETLELSDIGGSYPGRKTKPNERSWATAAAVACAVQQGAAVIRVHDIMAMGDVVRVSAALWGSH
jgi:dihydroneopterin aldolase/2-amino-4-hydroxy-6-hydroxymethyldihydropteridine diphosphokinase/dihydropteroate synthase